MSLYHDARILYKGISFYIPAFVWYFTKSPLEYFFPVFLITSYIYSFHSP